MYTNFKRNNKQGFYKVLTRRVNDYFKTHQLRKTGNYRLYLKSVVMIALLVVPYFVILGVSLSWWWQLLLCLIAGLGMAGIGMNIMHDGNHGSFSSRPIINKIMGSTIYFLAGNANNWKVQHNFLHHTFTNIHGHDEDLEASGILRFSEHQPWKPIHRFQHLYSIFLYGLLTINWAIVSDFSQMRRYLRDHKAVAQTKSPVILWSHLILTKILYFIGWLAIPYWVLGIAFWKILLGFFVMHYTAGLILSLIFQLAHVIEDTHMPLPKLMPDKMEHSWAIHQLFTTANFSPKNRWINWYVGGLNFQIEHHIFPHISHIHYQKIAKILKKTAEEFNLPYYEYKSTRSALFSHFKYLKRMGIRPVLVNS